MEMFELEGIRYRAETGDLPKFSKLGATLLYTEVE